MHEIDAIRKSYMEEYDALFKRIQLSVKGSEEHKRLLIKERDLYRRSAKFIDDNKGHFVNRRRAFWDGLEELSGVGEIKNPKDGRINNRFHNEKANKKVSEKKSVESLCDVY